MPLPNSIARHTPRVRLLLSFAALSACAAAAADEPASTIPSFPSGFDWPAKPGTLERAVEKRDWAAIREHGWWLWAGLNTDAAKGEPLWRAWPTSTQAFATGSTGMLGATAGHGRTINVSHHINTPINLPSPWYPVPTVSGDTCQTGTSTDLPDGPRFAANGDVLIADVVYNQDAYDWVRNTPLNQASVLTTQWQNGVKNISPFPSASFVLKHMYWPVQGSGYTALPVWHPEKYPPQTASYIGYEEWKNVVAIDPSNAAQHGKKTQVSFLYHFFKDDKTTPFPTRTEQAPIVPIDAFYHHRVDSDELVHMDPNDRTILNASACWLYNRPFQAGDYLVSVAMHINTKEIPGWTLQSLWWSDEPDKGPFAQNRPKIDPKKAPGPWRHYLLTSEYGIEASPGMLPVAFNPFIELAAGHPIRTNCRNCHTRAAWPRSGAINPDPPVTASYEAQGGPGPLADIKPDDKIFDKLLRVDFQWAVSDRAH